MGQKLSTAGQDFEPSVTVNVKLEKGQFFKGVLKAHKTPPSPYKNQDGSAKTFNVYEFELIDTDMELTIKKGDVYVEAKGVTGGDLVSIFAPTRLNNALSKAVLGASIHIMYLGKGKAGKMGGAPHMFDVEVI